MELRKIVSGIKPLQTHVLQEYLELQIESWSSEVDWKQVLVEELNQHNEKQVYQDAQKKILIVGLDHYSVRDMDITLISNLLKYGGEFKCPFKIRCHLENLCEDRNLDAHSDMNEDEMELFVWSTGALHNLRIFVESVYKNNNLPEIKRKDFIKKYSIEIFELLNEIKRHYNENFEQILKINDLNEKISIILNTENDPMTYYKIREIILLERDKEKYDQFVFMAAERGVKSACIELGDVFFHRKNGGPDFKKAEYYYEKAGESLTVHNKLNLASIYVNGFSDKHSKDDGLKLIEGINLVKTEIVKTITPEGYIFYGTRIKR